MSITGLEVDVAGGGEDVEEEVAEEAVVGLARAYAFAHGVVATDG